MLNGKKLFEVPNEEYPADVKKRVDVGEELNKSQQEHIDFVNKAIISALDSLLPNLPEHKFTDLNVDFRFYLNLHSVKGEKTSEYRQRLRLMIILCKIAERIYKHHVNMNDCLNVSLASIKFSLGGPGYADWKMSFDSECLAMSNVLGSR